MLSLLLRQTLACALKFCHACTMAWSNYEKHFIPGENSQEENQSGNVLFKLYADALTCN